MKKVFTKIIFLFGLIFVSFLFLVGDSLAYYNCTITYCQANCPNDGCCIKNKGGGSCNLPAPWIQPITLSVNSFNVTYNKNTSSGPDAVVSGGAFNVNWSVSPSPAGSGGNVYCSVSGGASTSGGASGSVSVTAPSASASAYSLTLSCHNDGGASTSASTSFNVVQSITDINGCDGICGSAAATSSTKPTINLCSAGTASEVTGTGPWSWTCSATAPGLSDAACAASCAPAYSNYTCEHTNSIDCSLEDNCEKKGMSAAFCVATNSCTGGQESVALSNCVGCSSSGITCGACPVHTGKWVEVAP